MSKLLLGLIAFSCLLAFSAAADVTNTTLIQYESFSTMDCSGTRTFGYNITAGCGSSTQGYYVSADNAYVLQFSYNALNCPTANLTYAVQIPVGVCGASGYYGGGSWTKYTIFTNVVNPTATFPPSGFTTATLYLNSTDSKPSTTCASTDRTVMSAFPTVTVNACKSYDQTSGLSYQKFQDSTCTQSATVYYSDSTCTNAVKMSTKTVEFKSCNSGYLTTCGGTGIPSFDNMPIGYTQFDNNACSSNSAAQTVSSVDGGCYAGTQLACSTQNNTQVFGYTAYANANCTGTVQGSRYFQINTCLITGDTVNVTAFCSGGGGGGNSAAAASVSAIVMIVGAFVALVAGRSL